MSDHKPNSPKDKEPKQDHPMGTPDPETLGTTDPQEHMKGPVSSFMQKTKHTVEENSEPNLSEEEERKNRE